MDNYSCETRSDHNCCDAGVNHFRCKAIMNHYSCDGSKNITFMVVIQVRAIIPVMQEWDIKAVI